MISFITGTVESLMDGAVIINNGGIGYLIQVSAATMTKLPKDRESVKLHTYMSVREDGFSLFGFLTQEELKMFNMLITVSGIGPKVAMGLLAAIPPKDLMLAIVTGDTSAICKAQGIGKKTAGRLVLELKDKISTGEIMDNIDGVISPQQTLSAASSEKQDAIEALMALGYGKSDSVKTVMEIALPGMTADSIIRLALKKLN